MLPVLGDGVIFCCVKAGTAYGPEYVNNLAQMIARNITQDFKLYCLTDDPQGLDERIDVIPLPDDLEKWWGKLYLFKPGLFPKGERICFFDLDTVILGNLDEILTYDGPFATLIDFYWPHLLGPAMMLWKAGENTKVWDEWVAQEKPRHPMGDLWWINTLDDGKFANKADRLQWLFPYQFVSFKVHCNPNPHELAKVVIFHGHPKPSDIAQGHWVRNAWR